MKVFWVLILMLVAQLSLSSALRAETQSGAKALFLERRQMIQ